MTPKSILACAALMLWCQGTVLAAQDIDYSAIAREVSGGAQFDQFVTPPTQDAVKQRHAEVLKRLPPSDHGAFTAAANSLSDRSVRMDYYDKVLKKLPR